jgi:hypothetical protein
LKTRAPARPTHVGAAVTLVGALILGLILGPHLLADAQPADNRPVPIPRVSEGEGYVTFHIQWRPTGYQGIVTLDDLTVNGQRYPVERRPVSLPTDHWLLPTDHWDSPRIPNHLPPEQVKAHLRITIERPTNYLGQLWVGCTVEINGHPAPGYDGLRGARTRRNSQNTLPYKCQAPPG